MRLDRSGNLVFATQVRQTMMTGSTYGYFSFQVFPAAYRREFLTFSLRTAAPGIPALGTEMRPARVPGCFAVGQFDCAKPHQGGFSVKLGLDGSACPFRLSEIMIGNCVIGRSPRIGSEFKV
jgi:hypothetical protein